MAVDTGTATLFDDEQALGWTNSIDNFEEARFQRSIVSLYLQGGIDEPADILQRYLVKRVRKIDIGARSAAITIDSSKRATPSCFEIVVECFRRER